MSSRDVAAILVPGPPISSTWIFTSQFAIQHRAHSRPTTSKHYARSLTRPFPRTQVETSTYQHYRIQTTEPPTCHHQPHLTMQVKTVIVYITAALAAVTLLQAPQVLGEEMTYSRQRQQQQATVSVVISSYGKTISPARVKVMQNEQKILGHSPYAKAAGVDLSKIEASTVPVVTPAPVPAPVPAPTSAQAQPSGATPISADAPLSPERIEIIQMELKELGYSPHAEATGVDLKKAGFVVPDRTTPGAATPIPDAANSNSTPDAATTTTSASDPSTNTNANANANANTSSGTVQTGAGY